jgi:hypothetical protein
MADDTKKLGEVLVAGGEERTPFELMEANLDRLSRHFANTLPADVCFVLVLGKKGDVGGNMIATDLDNRETIERLYKVRDQVKDGTIKMAWSKDIDVRESRIVRVN